MEKAFTSGVTDATTRANIKTIKKTGLGSIAGAMADLMKVFGKMENNTEKANMFYRIQLSNGEFGIMEKE